MRVALCDDVILVTISERERSARGNVPRTRQILCYIQLARIACCRSANGRTAFKRGGPGGRARGCECALVSNGLIRIGGRRSSSSTGKNRHPGLVHRGKADLVAQTEVTRCLPQGVEIGGKNLACRLRLPDVGLHARRPVQSLIAVEVVGQ